MKGHKWLSSSIYKKSVHGNNDEYAKFGHQADRVTTWDHGSTDSDGGCSDPDGGCSDSGGDWADSGPGHCNLCHHHSLVSCSALGSGLLCAVAAAEFEASGLLAAGSTTTVLAGSEPCFGGDSADAWFLRVEAAVLWDFSVFSAVTTFPAVLAATLPVAACGLPSVVDTGASWPAEVEAAGAVLMESAPGSTPAVLEATLSVAASVLPAVDRAGERHRLVAAEEAGERCLVLVPREGLVHHL